MKTQSVVAAGVLCLGLTLGSAAHADGNTPPPPSATPATPATPAAPTADAPASMTTTTSSDVTATAMAPAAPSEPKETVLYQKRTPNRFFLYTGGAALVGSYATTAVIAANEGSVKDHDLYLPVVGPWINLASRDSATTSTTDTVLILGSGLLQGVGAGMVVASFFVPEKYATATIAAGPVKMHVTPTAGAGSGGVGAFGTF